MKKARTGGGTIKSDTNLAVNKLFTSAFKNGQRRLESSQTSRTLRSTSFVSSDFEGREIFEEWKDAQSEMIKLQRAFPNTMASVMSGKGGDIGKPAGGKNPSGVDTSGRGSHGSLSTINHQGGKFFEIVSTGAPLKPMEERTMHSKAVVHKAMVAAGAPQNACVVWAVKTSMNKDANPCADKGAAHAAECHTFQFPKGNLPGAFKVSDASAAGTPSKGKKRTDFGGRTASKGKKTQA